MTTGHHRPVVEHIRFRYEASLILTGCWGDLTVPELRKLHEAVAGELLDRDMFRREMRDKLAGTGDVQGVGWPSCSGAEGAANGTSCRARALHPHLSDGPATIALAHERTTVRVPGPSSRQPRNHRTVPQGRERARASVPVVGAGAAPPERRTHGRTRSQRDRRSSAPTPSQVLRAFRAGRFAAQSPADVRSLGYGNPAGAKTIH